jgi:ATP-dependent Clp protease ATP-binding subunit ClpC
MFEKFTEQGVQAIGLAQEEAKRLGKNMVGSEHILLGLLSEKTGLASHALGKEGVTLRKVRNSIVRLWGRGSDFSAKDFPFTPGAKRILERSSFVALKQGSKYEKGSKYVGTEHLLLALLDMNESAPAYIFDNLSVDPASLRQTLLALIEESETISQYLSDDAIVKQVNDEIRKGFDKHLDEQLREEEKNQELVKPFQDISNKDKDTNAEALETYTTDLTKQARDGKLDPVIGRKKEVQRVIQILARRKKNNPVLIGEPGVGKTAVAEGLAQLIVKGDIPTFLENKKIVALDMGSLLAGTKYRGEFEERLKKVMDEVQSSSDIILVIDEVHNLIGAGAAEGAVDAANILKPALARGELQCIGATTIEEYRKHIEKDPALERRFQPVKVPEPTVDETIQILRGLRNRYERHHQLKINDEALVAAATLGSQFIADRFLPDKAIDLIDEASARVRLINCKLPEAAKAADKELRDILNLKDLAISNQKFEDAHEYHAKEIELRASISSILKVKAKKDANTIISKSDDSKLQVYEADVAEVVSAWTGIPVTKVSKNEIEKLVKMEELLHERVIGQEVAVSAISKAIRRARVGLKNPNRPIASFIFSGPTGVGKTELTKALASYFFGSEDSMVRLDMSEYMERHNMAKLIGSPPGYVGFSEGGLLTEEVRRKPYAVVLFDEVEKAHPDVFNLLLQILEDGRLTDSKGRLIDFKNTLIILTSNIGAKSIEKDFSAIENGVSFDSLDRASAYNKMAKSVQEELKQYFRPEFLNRLDEIIVFQQLTQRDVRKIADIMVKQLIDRIKLQGINLKINDNVKDKLSQDGFNPIYGARPLRRVIMSALEDPLANLFLKHPLVEGTDIIVSLKDDESTIDLKITGVTPSKKESLDDVANQTLSKKINSSQIESRVTRYSRNKLSKESSEPLTFEERSLKGRKNLLSIILEKKRREADEEAAKNKID